MGRGLTVNVVMIVPVLVTSVYVPACVCHAFCRNILSPSQIEADTLVVCPLQTKNPKVNIYRVISRFSIFTEINKCCDVKNIGPR